MIQRMGQEPAGVCAVPDENLLMYLHGALPPTARFRTGRHLRRCPACRGRLAAFTATSQALADTLRGDALPRWSPPTLPAPGLLPQATLPILFLCVALLTLTASVWMTAAHDASLFCSPAAEAAVTTTAPPTPGCDKGLAMTMKPGSVPVVAHRGTARTP